MTAADPVVCGNFDWLLTYSELKAYLCPEWLGKPYDSHVLVVGCGNSTLSEGLYGAGYHTVTNVDIDYDTIQEMEARHKARPGMRWICADIAAIGAWLAPHSVGVALDKGTFDAMLCGELTSVSHYLCAVWEALEQGGVLCIVSLYPETFLKPLFDLPGGPFRATHTTVPDKSAWCALLGRRSGVSLMKLIRNDGPPPEVSLVEAHLRQCVDQLVREEHPLLTPQVYNNLQQRFAAAWEARHPNGPATSDQSRALPLEEAYRVMFDEALRSEYSLNEFLTDWQAHTMTLQAEPGDEVVTFELAIRFLADMQ